MSDVGRMEYPVYQVALNGNERVYVEECLASTWISSRGRFLGEFEESFRRYTGAAHATSVCNGTVALHLALRALGIGPGDEVIVPTLTYVATANAVEYCGARVVFCDVLRGTWLMDAESARRQVTGRTRALIVPHLYGQACAMDELIEVAREFDLRVVEDCAEAFGVQYRGRHVGTVGDVGTFSFFGNKTITTGEGGMVVTGDAALHERMAHLKSQAVATAGEYWHDDVGYNYRMTNVCAAIGLAQMEQAEGIVARKRRVEEWYRGALAGAPLTWPKTTEGAERACWLVSALAQSREERDGLRVFLRERGIETRPLFAPVHRMPMYCEGQREFPVADEIAGRGLSLPSSPVLEQEDVERIAGAVRAYFQSRGEA